MFLVGLCRDGRNVMKWNDADKTRHWSYPSQNDDNEWPAEDSMKEDYLEYAICPGSGWSTHRNLMESVGAPILHLGFDAHSWIGFKQHHRTLSRCNGMSDRWPRFLQKATAKGDRWSGVHSEGTCLPMFAIEFWNEISSRCSLAALRWDHWSLLHIVPVVTFGQPSHFSSIGFGIRHSCLNGEISWDSHPAKSGNVSLVVVRWSGGHC